MNLNNSLRNRFYYCFCVERHLSAGFISFPLGSLLLTFILQFSFICFPFISALKKWHRFTASLILPLYGVSVCCLIQSFKFSNSEHCGPRLVVLKTRPTLIIRSYSKNIKYNEDNFHCFSTLRRCRVLFSKQGSSSFFLYVTSFNDFRKKLPDKFYTL